MPRLGKKRTQKKRSFFFLLQFTFQHSHIICGFDFKIPIQLINWAIFWAHFVSSPLVSVQREVAIKAETTNKSKLVKINLNKYSSDSEMHTNQTTRIKRNEIMRYDSWKSMVQKHFTICLVPIHAFCLVASLLLFITRIAHAYQFDRFDFWYRHCRQNRRFCQPHTHIQRMRNKILWHFFLLLRLLSI